MAKRSKPKQPTFEVHRWFNPFHKHVHQNPKTWLGVVLAIVVVVLLVAVASNL